MHSITMGQVTFGNFFKEYEGRIYHMVPSDVCRNTFYFSKEINIIYL